MFFPSNSHQISTSAAFGLWTEHWNWARLPNRAVSKFFLSRLRFCATVSEKEHQKWLWILTHIEFTTIRNGPVIDAPPHPRVSLSWLHRYPDLGPRISWPQYTNVQCLYLWVGILAIEEWDFKSTFVTLWNVNQLLITSALKETFYNMKLRTKMPN